MMILAKKAYCCLLGEVFFFPARFFEKRRGEGGGELERVKRV